MHIYHSECSLTLRWIGMSALTFSMNEISRWVFGRIHFLTSICERLSAKQTTLIEMLWNYNAVHGKTRLLAFMEQCLAGIVQIIMHTLYDLIRNHVLSVLYISKGKNQVPLYDMHAISCERIWNMHFRNTSTEQLNVCENMCKMFIIHTLWLI